MASSHQRNRPPPEALAHICSFLWPSEVVRIRGTASSSWEPNAWDTAAALTASIYATRINEIKDQGQLFRLLTDLTQVDSSLALLARLVVKVNTEQEAREMWAALFRRPPGLAGGWSFWLRCILDAELQAGQVAAVPASLAGLWQRMLWNEWTRPKVAGLLMMGTAEIVRHAPRALQIMKRSTAPCSAIPTPRPRFPFGQKRPSSFDPVGIASHIW